MDTCIYHHNLDTNLQIQPPSVHPARIVKSQYFTPGAIASFSLIACEVTQ